MKADNLADEIDKILSSYKDATYEALIEASDIVGEETKQQVVNNITGKIGGTGKYIKAITYSNMAEKTNEKYVGVVHVKAPHYRLSHLLEYGHALRNGGRYAGVKHFAPAEEYASKRILEVLPQVIERKAK